MLVDEAALQELINKEAIRDLVLCYSRAIDRKDVELLRDLYSEDAIDTHGDSFDGTAAEFCQYIADALPHMPYSGHHVCNHLISIDGSEGSGEVYALAIHYLPDPDNPGQWIEDFMCVRYLDNYRRCADGKWRFSRRFVTYDMRVVTPCEATGLLGSSPVDPSYEICRQRLFQRGPRAAVGPQVPVR